MATYRYGDVNQDGIIDPFDALLTIRSVAGTYRLTPLEMALADVNRNADVDAVDARIILQHFAGINLIYDTAEFT